jgi:hypothetical protein
VTISSQITVSSLSLWTHECLKNVRVGCRSSPELTREFGFRVQENHDTSGVRLNVVCLDELQLAFDLLLGHYTHDADY